MQQMRRSDNDEFAVSGYPAEATLAQPVNIYPFLRVCHGEYHVLLTGQKFIFVPQVKH